MTYTFLSRNVITVFSVPNYMYRAGNDGAMMEVDQGLNYAL